MDTTNLVSIIVPIYGVEAYLCECVDSLLVQTHQNLEILLIDDASPDGCAEICDQYARKDPRVKVIHKPNGGAASARNAGLDAAVGAYICFVDADDVVEKEYVQYLLNNLMKASADIAVCGYYNLTKTQRLIMPCQNPGTYDQTEYLSRFLKDWSCSLLWNKIYRREVIGSLRMSEGHKIDDEFFTYQVVMNCKKLVVTDVPLYGYRMRVSSVMHETGSNAERILLDRIEYTATRYRNVAQRYPDLKQTFLLDAVDSMTRYWCCSKNMPKAQKDIRGWVKQHVGQILTLRIPLHIKLLYLYHLYFRKPAAPSADIIKTDHEDYYD